MNIDNPALAEQHQLASANDAATLSSLVAGLQRSLTSALPPAFVRNPDDGSTVPGQPSQAVYLPTTSSKKRKYDAALLHPLVVSSESFASSAIADKCEQLSRTLSSFETAVLDSKSSSAAGAGVSGDVPGNAGQASLSNNERLRLFALLKEQASLLYSHNSTQDAVHSATDLLSKSRVAKRKNRYPFHVAKQDTVQTILERIAKECRLEIFAGIADDEALPDEQGTGMDIDTGAGEAQSSNIRKTTMTMAGKGLVLDVDIEVPVAPGTMDRAAPERGSVQSVRFSHGMEGSTDAGIDRLLTRQAQRADWDSFRQSLAHLSKLDNLVSAPTAPDSQPAQMEDTPSIDPFGAMKTLSMRLEQVFEAELEVASSPKMLFSNGNGLPVLNRKTPYATLVYHIPAEGFFSEAWEKLVEDGFRQSGGVGAHTSILDASIDGIRSISFELEKGSQPPLPSFSQHKAERYPLAQNEALIDSLREGVAPGLRFIAKMDREICISQAAGRKLDAILRGSSQTPGSDDFGAQALSIPSNLQTFEHALLPEIGSGKTYCLPGSDGADSAKSLRISLAGSSTPNRAYKVRNLTFYTVEQLLECVRILRTQCLMEELLSKAFEGTVPSLKVPGEGDESQIKLEDLFSDKSPSELPMTISIDGQAWPPVMSCIMAVPHLPGWLPVNLNLRISVGESGLSISTSFQSGPSGLHERLQSILDADGGKGKLQAVLDTTRDVKSLFRWIERRMAKHADVWQGVVDRPAL